MREGEDKCELGKNKRKWGIVTALKEQDVVKSRGIERE